MGRPPLPVTPKRQASITAPAAARDPFAGLRGLLALWVLFGHLILYDRFGDMYNAGFARAEDLGFLAPLAILHFIAVDIFFMLSGFVLTRHYYDRFTQASTGKSIDAFYWARFKRLWPMHAAMVALIGLYQIIGIPHPISSGLGDQIFAHWKWTLFLNLTLLNGWGLIPVASWNEPAWSLSIIFLLSVLFPNFLLMLKRLPQRRYLYTAFILLLILGFAAARELWPLQSYSDGTGAILRGILFFTSGMLLSLADRSGLKLPPVDPRLFCIIFFAAILGWSYLAAFPLVCLQLLYAPLLLAIDRNAKPILPIAFAQWIGNRSFAVFMTHYPSLLAMDYLAGPTLKEYAAAGTISKIACYAATLAWVLIAAELAYRLLDRPRQFRRAG